MSRYASVEDMAKIMGKSVTDQQQRFIDAYIECLNGAEAARRAGYSKKSAGDLGGQLLRNPRIRGVVAKRLEELHQRSRRTQEECIDFWEGLAFGDPEKLFKSRLDPDTVSLWARMSALEKYQAFMGYTKGVNGHNDNDLDNFVNRVKEDIDRRNKKP
jgi:hypothetical protein